eukprot:TRINITY_DN2935_c0_g5_i3.p4 TRINITY_DN2935_c0_g5~~TRINITY_DN2935_c0_g5_i3.p4  ORF type:complete len:122 (-),score=2.03 TRINITY_DN2935_c0_g5_i3:567-932(-)
MRAVEELLHEWLARMGEGTMADIVEEGRGNNEPALVLRKAEPPARQISKEHGAQRMLEPGMVGARVDKIREPQLLDVAEALEGRGIEEGERKILEFHITMDRVLDDLLIHQRIFIYIAQKY